MFKRQHVTHFFYCLPLFFAGLVGVAHADEGVADANNDQSSWYERSWDTLSETYTKGKSELYLPLHTHHMRFAYTQDKINGFNEKPYGLGYGLGSYDDKGNWHGLYVMGFQDSHFQPQWMAGYGWKAMWGDQSSWHYGLGYTAFVTTRADIAHYAPIVAALPLASVGYKKFSLETTYVPGAKGVGNILFLWGKWQFGE